MITKATLIKKIKMCKDQGMPYCEFTTGIYLDNTMSEEAKIMFLKMVDEVYGSSKKEK